MKIQTRPAHQPLLVLFLALLTVACGAPSARFNAKTRAQEFDRFFDALEHHYPYFDDLELPWQSIVDSARRQALAAETREEFVCTIAQTLAQIGDPHIALEVPFATYRTLNIPWSIAQLEVLPIQKSLYAIDWDQSIKQHGPLRTPKQVPEILAIDGVQPQLGLLQALLSGPPKSPVRLQLRWPDANHHRRGRSSIASGY